MKFSEMKYVRPDAEELKRSIEEIRKRFEKAAAYDEARQAFLDMDKVNSRISTLYTLVEIRNSIDTRDEFYDAEMTYLNGLMPELEQYIKEFSAVMLKSPFKNELAREFGELMFLNTEIDLKTFSPEIIEDMQRENLLVMEHDKLIASAAIPFEGGTYTLSQLTPFATDADDERRLKAWKAMGGWYKENRDALDDIYKKLVEVRDGMGRKLGYDGFTELGYYRMQRNCYTKEDVAGFRDAVVKYVVPLAAKIRKKQAKRLGVSYPMSFSDEALMFRSGNPRPAGDADYLVSEAKKFYEQLSPETGEFFDAMLEGELMDLLSKEGKGAGGFCAGLEDYHMPFIFANFNGTQDDVDVLTHEAGHAFAAYMNRFRVPIDNQGPTAEACEVHSMSMEFFGWQWADRFYGKDAAKARYSHLAESLTFIPYGTMVDHFQHLVYEKPITEPAEFHAAWKKLMGIYMPWIRLDGEIPFYSDGEHWQAKLHIFCYPFYYIDYCLAQTCALQFWALMQKDRAAAWEKYMTYTREGGTRTFTDLLIHAGLKTPFEDECLKGVCETAAEWLDAFDADALE